MTAMEKLMIPVYADLIRKDVKTLEDVPKNLRSDVEQFINNEQTPDA